MKHLWVFMSVAMVLGCNEVVPGTCTANPAGGAGGAGTIPPGDVGASAASGDYAPDPPKEPLGTGSGDCSDPCMECSSAPAAAIAGCSFRVDNPHESMHFPGTVNVVATVQCNRPVSRIEMTLGLARDGQEVIRSTFTNSEVAMLRDHVDTPCVNGAYQGAAAAMVTFPPGSLPASGTLNANSSTLQITCN